MNQLVRKKTLGTSRIGHYELSGSVWATHNYEFSEMAYSGTLGVFFQNTDASSQQTIDKDRVRSAYASLQAVHALLRRYDLQPLVMSLVNYHISQNGDRVGAPSGWQNNILLSVEETNPQAAECNFNDLLIGTDSRAWTFPLVILLCWPSFFHTYFLPVLAT